MFTIGHVKLEDDIASATFCCNLSECKGACCTLEGGRGAPLEDREVLAIEQAFQAVKPMLSPESLRRIEQSGLVDGTPGDFATPCIDNKACVYAIIEDGIASCSFERAFLGGHSKWRKPISCHLFPIRRSPDNHMRYERIDECKAGRELGKQSGTPLHTFLKDPLIRLYGEPWYGSLTEQCQTGSNCEGH